MAVPTTAAELLDAVRQSRLLDDNALADYSAATGDPETLGERLLADGRLTPLQVRMLLQGKRRGFVLAGKYRLLDLLGSGGMGTVFLCEHARLRTLVAVKVLPPERLAEPAALERFNREARAAAVLAHPNLVRAFDIDEDEGYHFLVMEYVRGVSLQALVERRGALAASAAAGLVRQAALGLHHAHERGLVHRDVKPANLLLDEAGTLKILDLGLARFARDSDRVTAKHEPNSILGTADYLAPEQARPDAPVVARADIYALGATLFFLLAGQPPFAAASLAEKMLADRPPPPPLRDFRPDVPADLEALLQRMMAAEPEQRPESMLAVADALAAWADEQRTPAPDDALPALCPAIARRLRTPDNLPTEERSPAATTARMSPASSGMRRWSIAAGIVAVGALAFLMWLWFLPPSPPAPRVPDRGTLPNIFDGLERDRPLDPDTARRRVGQTWTVLVYVRSRSRAADGSIQLHSRSDPVDPRAFTIVLDPEMQLRLAEAGIKDPYSHFHQVGVLVTGPIVYLDNGRRTGIIVAQPEQIRLAPDS